MTANDASEIALKWATRLGIGFHPDTYGGDYEPPLSPEEVDEYEDDMGRLFSPVRRGHRSLRGLPRRHATRGLTSGRHRAAAAPVSDDRRR